jgi:uncharacterized protein (DUF1501 family)
MATLDRRQFLSGIIGSGSAVAAARVRGLGGRFDLDSITRTSAATKGPLVLCTLFGGNDGLNTVIPYDVGQYRDWRGDLAIPADQVLPLGTFEDIDLGFHPSMTGLQALFNAGHVAVVCGVEYPNANFSHFQSTTIWQTASLADDTTSGWIGRWLDQTGSNPMRALGVGPTLQQGLIGVHQQASTIDDSTSASAQVPGQNPIFMAAYKELMAPYSGQLTLERAAATSGANVITVGNAAAAALTKEAPPADPSKRNAGDIGTQLAVVAECIEAGLPTEVYNVGFGSFDTHADQLDIHAGLLTQLDAAIENFMTAFPAPAAGKSPVIVVTSEFGRTPRVNASDGTDHSTASIVLVVGPAVKGGFYGHVPSFTKLDEYGNLIYTTDFRAIYATVLEDVLGVDAATTKGILGASFANLGFL